MDGERKECPIIPDMAIHVKYGDDEDNYLLVAPSHDTIQLFPDSRYNHLKYFDPAEGGLRPIWLPAHVLADLHDMGIPHTRRESITECEYEAYQTYMGRLAGHVVEVEEVGQLALPAGDPIDAEVQKASQNLDAEIEFYLGHEWE